MKWYPNYNSVGTIRTVKKFAFLPKKIFKPNYKFYWIWLEFYYKDYICLLHSDGEIRWNLNKLDYQK